MEEMQSCCVLTSPILYVTGREQIIPANENILSAMTSKQAWTWFDIHGTSCRRDDSDGSAEVAHAW